MEREPCPYRIIDDIGGAYLFGAVLGGGFHFLKGARNAPKGGRLAGSLAAVKARAPILGGNFAVWGGLFACCDCTMVAIRRKEDPWNSIFSGFATGGILALRAGPKVAAKNAVVGGILLAAIEGMVIATNNYFSKAEFESRNAQPQEQQASLGPKRPELAPPITMPSFSTRSEEDLDRSSRGRQPDQISDDTILVDPFAQSDSFNRSSTMSDAQVPETSNRGWMSRLLGRGK